MSLALTVDTVDMPGHDSLAYGKGMKKCHESNRRVSEAGMTGRDR